MRTIRCAVWMIGLTVVPGACLGQVVKHTAAEAQAVREFSVAGISLNTTLADLKKRFPNGAYQDERDDIHTATIQLEKALVTATFKKLAIISLNVKGKGTRKDTVAKWEKKFGKADSNDKLEDTAVWTFGSEGK